MRALKCRYKTLPQTSLNIGCSGTGQISKSLTASATMISAMVIVIIMMVSTDGHHGKSCIIVRIIMIIVWWIIWHIDR